MAYTLDTLKEEVRRYLDAWNDPNFDASFPGYVRQCEERIYQACKIQPFRQSGRLELLAGEVDVVLPTNYARMISVGASTAVEPAYGVNLIQKQVDWIDEIGGAYALEGTPLFYGIFTDALDRTILRIVPRDGRAADVHMQYYGKPKSLADIPHPGTTWLSVNAEPTLLYGVLYYAYINEKGEDDVLKMYQGEFDKGLLLLRNIAREGRMDEFRSSPQAAPEA